MGLLEKFQAYSPVELEAVGDLRRHVRFRSLSRGEALFLPGDEAHDVHFLHSGVVKLSFFTASGAERVREFKIEGQMFASMASLRGARVADYGAIACEACELESLGVEYLSEMARTHLSWSQCIAGMYLDIAQSRGRREQQLLTLTAAERLEAAFAERPWLAHKVTQQDLASYIGVTPVSLSRLKSRLAMHAGRV